jgi:hypothetical protein
MVSKRASKEACNAGNPHPNTKPFPRTGLAGFPWRLGTGSCVGARRLLTATAPWDCPARLCRAPSFPVRCRWTSCCWGWGSACADPSPCPCGRRGAEGCGACPCSRPCGGPGQRRFHCRSTSCCYWTMCCWGCVCAAPSSPCDPCRRPSAHACHRDPFGLRRGRVSSLRLSRRPCLCSAGPPVRGARPGDARTPPVTDKHAMMRACVQRASEQLPQF